jgi:LemA protein
MSPIFILLACVVVLGLGVLGILAGVYNSLIKLRVLVEEAWSGIDVQLKKRYDLIPNLVNTVKGYSKHEKDVFERVTKLRSAAMGAKDVDEKIELENQLSSTLKTLFAVAESYPELKADTSFLNLQSQLSAIEEELEGARRYYNGTVRNYNMQLSTFPVNILAGIFNFQSKAFFEAESEARDNVKVDFTEEAK